MGMRVAVAGASGYAGGELLRLIAGHPDLELAAITASSSAGKTVGELHPNLAGLAGLVSQTFLPHGAGDLSGCDLVFMSLPAGQSAVLAASIADGVKIVDLGPDFRLADAEAWSRHYGSAHAGRWVTGLPEVPGARAQVRSASRVAAPGCYATAAILALAPLVAAGLAEPDDIVVVAASGTSGAGRALRGDLLGSEVMGSVSAYQAGGVHRHTPEIEQAIREVASSWVQPGAGQIGRSGGVTESGLGYGPGGGSEGVSGGMTEGVTRGMTEGVTGGMTEGVTRGMTGSGPGDRLGRVAGGGLAGGPGGGIGSRSVRVSFTPLLAPMPRGILATCTARLTSPAIDTAALRSALAAAYAGEHFVCLLPDGRWPNTAAVAGSNGVHVQAVADSRSGRAVAVTAIDNLGKGAAGQAIQNANLMLGLAETAGLTSIGVAP